MGGDVHLSSRTLAHLNQNIKEINKTLKSLADKLNK